jgi:hypothetical protein
MPGGGLLNLTNNVVYERLAPGVLDELKCVTPRDDKGRRKHKYFDDDVPIATALRKCVVLGGRSGSEELRDWATRGLQGYYGQDDLPEYRVITAPLTVDGFAGNVHVQRQAEDGGRRAEVGRTSPLATTTKADLVLPMVECERQSLVEAERRLKAANDAMNSTPTEAPTDAMLDFQNAFREAVTKRISEAGRLAEVNQALRELFSAFAIHETAYEWWPTVDEGHPLTGRPVPTKDIIVQPFLKPSVAGALDPTVREAWRRRAAGWRPKIITSSEPPPVQALSAQNPRPSAPDGNMQHSHE